MSTVMHLSTLSLLTQHPAPHHFGSNQQKAFLSFRKWTAHLLHCSKHAQFLTPHHLVSTDGFYSGLRSFSRVRGQPPDFYQWQIPDVSQQSHMGTVPLVFLLGGNCKDWFASPPPAFESATSPLQTTVSTAPRKLLNDGPQWGTQVMRCLLWSFSLWSLPVLPTELAVQ